MTENKHFTIEKSFIAEDTFCIRDNSGKFSFPITPDKSELIMYQKALNELKEENEHLKSFKNDVYDLIDELIKKAEKDVEDLRKDAYEKGYAYNPYYYWGVAHGLEKLKKELKE